jgi:hypothetical protein
MRITSTGSLYGLWRIIVKSNEISNFIKVGKFLDELSD